MVSSLCFAFCSLSSVFCSVRLSERQLQFEQRVSKLRTHSVLSNRYKYIIFCILFSVHRGRGDRRYQLRLKELHEYNISYLRSSVYIVRYTACQRIFIYPRIRRVVVMFTLTYLRTDRVVRLCMTPESLVQKQISYCH